jgi:hypothetical protein
VPRISIRHQEWVSQVWILGNDILDSAGDKFPPKSGIVQISRQWKTYRTEKGSVYRLWERNMPRISDCFADCAIYLYASERAAKDGQNAGGSGFLIHVPSTTDSRMGRTHTRSRIST